MRRLINLFGRPVIVVVVIVVLLTYIAEFVTKPREEFLIGLLDQVQSYGLAYLLTALGITFVLKALIDRMDKIAWDLSKQIDLLERRYYISLAASQDSVQACFAIRYIRGKTISISGWSFKGADWSGANLTGLDLDGCDLSNVDLTSVILERTNLGGANLTGAYMRGAQVGKIYCNSATILPDGAAWVEGINFDRFTR